LPQHCRTTKTTKMMTQRLQLRLLQLQQRPVLPPWQPQLKKKKKKKMMMMMMMRRRRRMLPLLLLLLAVA